MAARIYALRLETHRQAHQPEVEVPIQAGPSALVRRIRQEQAILEPGARN